MGSAKITAGLLIPTPESLEQVRILAEASGSISVEIESVQYFNKPTDQSAREFIHAHPEIILVDIEDTQSGISSIETLHTALPEAHILAISKKADPKLIIQAVRAGAREFLQEPIQPRSFSQAIDRYLAEKQRMLENRKEGKIYCFMAGKEGTGVTSIAINIASAFAAMPGNRVALLDLDSPVGDAAIYLNLAPQHKIQDIFGAGARLDSLLLESCMSQADEFCLLPAPKEWGRQKTIGVETLTKLLKVAAQTYTHTIIDLPRSLSAEQLQAVAKATELLVVVLNPDLSSISRTGLLLRNLSSCEIPDKIRLVINRSHDSDEIDSSLIEKALHHPIFCSIPDNHRDSMKAMMAGKPLAANGRSELGQGYHKLARQLAGIPESKKWRRLSAGGERHRPWRSAIAALFSSGAKTSQPLPRRRHLSRRTGPAGTRLRMNLLNR